jgi:hypothetical protein
MNISGRSVKDVRRGVMMNFREQTGYVILSAAKKLYPR